jgi:hypothetical protein
MSNANRFTAVVAVGLGVLVIGLLYVFLPFIIVVSPAYKNLERTIQVYKADSLELHAVKSTLMLAYDLSDPEAEFFGYWFNKKAKQFNIPWMTFAAVAKIESGYDPTALSEAGAKGYMQMLDTTHQEQCQKLGIPFVKGKTPWIDVINVVCGSNYLAESKDTTFEVMVKRYLAPLHAKIKKQAKKEPDNVQLQKKAELIEKYYHNVRREFMMLSAIYAGIKK